MTASFKKYRLLKHRAAQDNKGADLFVCLHVLHRPNIAVRMPRARVHPNMLKYATAGDVFVSIGNFSSEIA